jgi:hypothetical protein
MNKVLEQTISVVQTIFTAIDDEKAKISLFIDTNDPNIQKFLDLHIDSSEHWAYQALVSNLNFDRKLINMCNISIGILSGAILQIAKQCLSIEFENCYSRKGRKIGSQHISDIIFNARNQSLHFEEEKIKNPHTKRCFEILAEEFVEAYDLNRNFRQNLATEVIELLGWNTFENYLADMQEIFCSS